MPDPTHLKTLNLGVERWSLSFGSLGRPICSVFRDDGERVYVSLLPSGIAIVDVPAMMRIGTLDTDGFVGCGMIKSKRGRIVSVASSGRGGHLYRLDTTTDTLDDLDCGLSAAQISACRPTRRFWPVRVLLDECLPNRLKRELVGHQARTGRAVTLGEG